MGHFRIHAQAIVDLEEIYCYIAVEKESPDAADRFIAELWRKIQFYALTPEIGLPRPDLADDLRSFTFKRHYVVIYRPVADGLHVLRVFHGSRDYPALI